MLVASGTRLTLRPSFSQSSDTASMTSGPSCAHHWTYGIHADLEAAGVSGLGQELLCALEIVGRDLPVGAVALVERIVVVRVRRLRALALPEPVDDRLLVDGEVQRQADLPRVLQALGVAGSPTHGHVGQ